MSVRRIVSIVLLGLAGFSAAQTSTDPTIVGQWSDVIAFPYRPVHVTLLPTGRVLFHSYYSESYYPQIWDPQSNTTVPAAKIDYQLFCNGHTLLPDGTVFMAGGHVADYVGTNAASIYDPAKDSWTQLPKMNAGRWYPTTTELPNGDVLVTSGSMDASQDADPLPQVWQRASNTWRDLTTAQLVIPLYPKMFLAPNGKVFYAGPSRSSKWLDTSGTGSWVVSALTNQSTWRDYGTAAMYEPGKVIIIGGNKPPVATAETIDLNVATQKWTWTGSMAYPRRHHTATVLPDGTVLVTGGTAAGGSWDDDSAPIKAAELWDPATGRFTLLASESIYRGYHSVAMLLPDGRVLSAGSNLGGPNGQIFSPPYLFKGPRPAITDAPLAADYGTAVSITTPDATSIAKVTLIALPSVTHTFNFNQHFVPLTFTSTEGSITATAPADGNIAPPGYYMLFLVNQQGVPSIAKMINVGGAPLIVPPPPPPPPPPPSTDGIVTGKVTNASSGAAITGASVAIGSLSTVTSSTGGYKLDKVPAGDFSMSVTRNGYLPRSLAGSVVAGATTILNAKLATAGRIAGKITTTVGTAIVGVTVTFKGGVIPTTATAKTNCTGNYLSSYVPVGSYTVSVTWSAKTQSQSATVSSGVTTTRNFVF